MEKETEQLEKNFEDKKKEGEEITNRVSDTINKFEDTNKLNNVQNATTEDTQKDSIKEQPENTNDIQNTSKDDTQNTSNKTTGGRSRATRKLRKRKHKASKRVRFYGLD